MIGALVLCATNAWGAENPAIGTTIAVPVLAGAFVLLRRAAARGGVRPGRAGASSPGWCCSGWAGTARWRRPGSATGGPTSADGRSSSLRCSPRSWCTCPASATGAAVAAGLTLVPLVLLANGPATTAPRPARPARGVRHPGRPSGWSPRSRRGPGPRAPPRSPALGVLLVGAAARRRPLAPHSRGSTPTARAPSTCDSCDVSPGAAAVDQRAASRSPSPRPSCCLLRHVPRSTAASRARSWVPSRPAVARPRRARRGARARAPVVGGCPGRGSRDRRSRPVPPGGRATSWPPRWSAAARRRTWPSSRCTLPPPTTC